MFIAHGPSGYILATSLLERARTAQVSARAVILSGIAGALAPDMDMLYFYLVDGRQTHHHKYITHWPIGWLVLLIAAAIWLFASRRTKTPFLLVVSFLAGLLHLALDSVVGDIWWFAPFVDKPFALFTVASVFKPWWLNFLLHWSFAVELGICLWALLLYRRRSKPA